MNTTVNKDRLIIPVEGPEINGFEVDDFLRLIHNPIARKRLAAEYGGSFAAAEQYEKSHGLPRGAIQLALLTDDERVQKMFQAIGAKILAAQESQDPQKLKEAVKEGTSISQGIQRLYPQAMDFIISYRKLVEQSQEAYIGDYKTYKIACSNSYSFQSTTYIFIVLVAVLGGLAVAIAVVIPVIP